MWVGGKFSSIKFPFLFGGTFIEAAFTKHIHAELRAFPFLFGGTFIEAGTIAAAGGLFAGISLPFRRDFH